MLVTLRFDAVMLVLMSMEVEVEVEVEVEATTDAPSHEVQGCGLGRIKRELCSKGAVTSSKTSGSPGESYQRNFRVELAERCGVGSTLHCGIFRCIIRDARRPFNVKRSA
jgi:hypothetical protein